MFDDQSLNTSYRHQSEMKNPVRFSNRKDQTIFIYHIYDNSFLQLATLEPKGTTIQNIPYGSHIAVKRGEAIEDMIVPIETIFETYLDKNFFFL